LHELLNAISISESYTLIFILYIFSGNVIYSIMALDKGIKTQVMTLLQEMMWRQILLMLRNCCSGSSNFRNGRLPHICLAQNIRVNLLVGIKNRKRINQNPSPVLVRGRDIGNQVSSGNSVMLLQLW
jgi:hypothetical protein